MESTERQNDHRLLLEDVGKLLGLVALLLPAAGFTVRSIFFYQFTVPATDIAIRAPLAELAATGFWALFPGAFYAGSIAFLARFAPQLEKATALTADMDRFGQQLEELLQRQHVTQEQLDEVRVRDRQLKARLAEAQAQQTRLQRILAEQLPDPPPWVLKLWWVPILLIALFLPGWPVIWLNLGSSLLLSLMALRVIRRTGRLALGRLWWVIIVVFLALAIASGLSNTPPGVYRQSITFQSPHGVLRNGLYEHVGDDETTYYLLTCHAGQHRLVAVQRDQVAEAIALTRRPTRFGTSLFSVLFLKQPIEVQTYHIC